MMKVLGIGEILWDVFPDQELLGGAPLNFVTNCRRLGHSSILFSAVGEDQRGFLALEAMHASGLSVDFIQKDGGHPTGTAMVSTDPHGEPTFEVIRPAAYDFLRLPEGTLADLGNCDFDWLYFGTLMQKTHRIEQITAQLAMLSPRIRCFYDVNLRSGQWDLPLVQRLFHLASIVKLNVDEARTLAKLEGTRVEAFSLSSFCYDLTLLFDVEVVCVTLGKDGCYIYTRGAELQVSGYTTRVHDTVGAGDAFSAALLHGFHQGWPTAKSAHFANAIGSLVASRPGATPCWSVEDAFAICGSDGASATVSEEDG